MRGGYLHNVILLRPLEAYFLGLGALVEREYPTGPGRKAGFVDLFVRYLSWRIACEVELTADRVLNDANKAALVRADLLVIVVPDWHVTRVAKRRLGSVDYPSRKNGPEIWVLPPGPALKRLRKRCQLLTTLNVSVRHQVIESRALRGINRTPGGIKDYEDPLA